MTTNTPPDDEPFKETSATRKAARAGLVQGSALVWASYDRTGVLTSAVLSILTELIDPDAVRLQLLTEAKHSDWSIEHLGPEARELGLVLWRLEDHADLNAVCSALQTCSAMKKSPVRVVYLDPELSSCTTILVEAGAQVVVSQLTSLQNALRAILPAAPLTHQGFHPLTSGLEQRLPWPELSDD